MKEIVTHCLIFCLLINSLAYCLPQQIEPKHVKSLVNSLISNLTVSVKDQANSIALLNIENATHEHLSMEYIEDRIKIELINIGNFDVIDRNKLETILEEQKLSASGLIDQQTAIELGEIIGVDAFLSGKITYFEKGSYSAIDSYYVLTLSLLETRTGRIIWTDDEEYHIEEKTFARNTLSWILFIGILVAALVNDSESTE